MISVDTTQVFLSEFTKICEKDPAIIQRMIGDFIGSEPYVASILMTWASTIDDGCSQSTTAILAVTLYSELLNRQENSDDLKKKFDE